MLLSMFFIDFYTNHYYTTDKWRKGDPCAVARITHFQYAKNKKFLEKYQIMLYNKIVGAIRC